MPLVDHHTHILSVNVSALIVGRRCRISTETLKRAATLMQQIRTAARAVGIRRSKFGAAPSVDLGSISQMVLLTDNKFKVIASNVARYLR